MNLRSRTRNVCQDEAGFTFTELLVLVLIIAALVIVTASPSGETSLTNETEHVAETFETAMWEPFVRELDRQNNEFGAYPAQELAVRALDADIYRENASQFRHETRHLDARTVKIEFTSTADDSWFDCRVIIQRETYLRQQTCEVHERVGSKDASDETVVYGN